MWVPGAAGTVSCYVAALSGFLWSQTLVEDSHALRGCMGRLPWFCFVRPVTQQKGERKNAGCPEGRENLCQTAEPIRHALTNALSPDTVETGRITFVR